MDGLMWYHEGDPERTAQDVERLVRWAFRAGLAARDVADETAEEHKAVIALLHVSVLPETERSGS